MKNAIKNITSHYQTAIAGDMNKMHVKEWNMDIYYRHTYSFKDEARIVELQTKGKMVEALVESLIVKSRDADGKRLFQDADKITLLNEADPTVITRICTIINNPDNRVDAETAVKE